MNEYKLIGIKFQIKYITKMVELYNINLFKGYDCFRLFDEITSTVDRISDFWGGNI